VPRMKSGDVDGAVSGGVAAILATISPSYKGATYPPEAASGEQNNVSGFAVFMLAVFALFFGFVVLMIIMTIVRTLRYGYLMLREGPKLAKRDMHNWPVFAGAILGGSGFSGGGGDFGGGGGGFSAGGGGFGGGGASGSW
jgi:uncharacterized protein